MKSSPSDYASCSITYVKQLSSDTFSSLLNLYVENGKAGVELDEDLGAIAVATQDRHDADAEDDGIDYSWIELVETMAYLTTDILKKNITTQQALDIAVRHLTSRHSIAVLVENINTPAYILMSEGEPIATVQLLHKEENDLKVIKKACDDHFCDETTCTLTMNPDTTEYSTITAIGKEYGTQSITIHRHHIYK